MNFRADDIAAADLLEAVADESALHSPDLTFRVDVQPPDLAVEGDPERLHQVFANLTDNAARFTPDRGEVVLKAHVVGDWAVFEVLDDGPGIPAEAASRVFERFYRTDEAAAQDALAERIDEKVGWLREGAGDRFDDLELNAWLAAAEVTDDPDLVEGIAALFGTDGASLRQSPLALIGSPGDVREMLAERRERWGYSYHVIPGDKIHDFAPIVADLTGT